MQILSAAEKPKRTFICITSFTLPTARTERVSKRASSSMRIATST